MEEEKQKDSVDVDPPFPEGEAPDPFAAMLNDVGPPTPDELFGNLPDGVKFLGELPVSSVAALKEAAKEGLPSSGPEAEKLLRKILGDEQYSALEGMMGDYAAQMLSGPDRSDQEIAAEWGVTAYAFDYVKVAVDKLTQRGFRQQVRVCAQHNWASNLAILREMRATGFEIDSEDAARHVLSHIIDAFFGGVMLSVVLGIGQKHLEAPFHEATLAIPDACDHHAVEHHILLYVMGSEEALDLELVSGLMAIDLAGMASLMLAQDIRDDIVDSLPDLFEQLLERDFTFEHAKDR